jgi:uncharacterized ferritin-like protein (DUF455 family)
MQAQLRKAGDAHAVAILDVILRDEIGHVAVGNHWYRWLCARDGLDPLAHYALAADATGHRGCAAFQPRRAPRRRLQRRRIAAAGAACRFPAVHSGARAPQGHNRTPP